MFTPQLTDIDSARLGKDGQTELTCVSDQDGLLAHRESSIQVLAGPGPTYYQVTLPL